MESAPVETTDVGKKITEKEPKVATEELSSEVPTAPLQSTGKHRAHCRSTYLRVNTKLHFIICKSVLTNDRFINVNTNNNAFLNVKCRKCNNRTGALLSTC